jgi:hypothetical protein
MLQLRTFSARRYRIEGGIPSPYDDAFHERLTDRRFLPLGAREEQTHGWVTADNLLLTTFDADTVVRGENAVFALRVDRRRVNPRVLRAQVDLEMGGRRRAAQDAGRPFRMSRDERRQARADLREALLRDTAPSVQVHTVLLHPGRKVLHVLALGRGANDLVVRAFRDTFQADLTPLTPWRRGREILAGSLAALSLDALGRTDFVSPRRAPEPAAAPARRLEPTATVGRPGETRP